LRFLCDELIERILDEAYRLVETRCVTLYHETLSRRWCWMFVVDAEFT